MTRQSERDMLKLEGFIKLAHFRRRVPGYRGDKDVPKEHIRAVLEAARWAPSGANSQPWEFVVIRDPVMRQRIVSLFLKQCRDKDEMELAVRGRRRGSATGFKNAPVFILVLGDPRVNEAFPVSTNLEMGQQHFITGLASATLMIHLAAASLSLGSQWVSDSGSPYMATMIKAWLGIPQHLKVYDLIPIGYPTRRPPAPPRRPLEEIVHWDRYDPGRDRSASDVKRFLYEQTYFWRRYAKRKARIKDA